ncbi:unnamed protein product [Parajaminaea phylloscopi]
MSAIASAAPSSSRLAARAVGSSRAASAVSHQQVRRLATPVSASASGSAQHRVLVIGGGAAGQAISHQLLRSGVFPEQKDIAIIDPKDSHDYQPGWTLVGAGLKDKRSLRRSMDELAGGSDGLELYRDAVESFDPENNRVKTRDGRTISYEHLVVVPGLGLEWAKVAGLKEALDDPSSNVASTYAYETVDNVWQRIQEHRRGPAIFTQPPQPHKCAGAPQKIMWLAWNHWKDTGVRGDIPITFATALPTMFSVPKYSRVLDDLRKEREVEGLFQHNLTSIEGSTATFTQTSGEKVTRPFNLLHVVPPQGPLPFVRNSPLSNKASGFVDVNSATTQHVTYSNVWSIGDSSSLPTSKTAAAITAQAPILVNNLIRSALGSENSHAPALAHYDGYTSCPLTTENGKVLLAEFKYDAQIKETFSSLFGVDQSQPNRAFWHLKKDFFPWVYFNSFLKGTWSGPKGWSAGNSIGVAAPRPSLSSASRGFASLAKPVQARGFATSSVASRDRPVRRPRDPLDTDATAVRFPLPSGETFIARPAPASSAAYPLDASIEAPSVLEDSSILPPLLKDPSKSKVTRTDLNETEIAEIQKLRSEDPLTNTPRQLAKRFGCSELFVRIVAPASTDVKAFRKQEDRVNKANRTFKQVLKHETRKARKELW